MLSLYNISCKPFFQSMRFLESINIIKTQVENCWYLFYPKQKRMHREQILVIHINLDRHLGIGLCRSFHPSNANFVAIYPMARAKPNITNLIKATGAIATTFTHSYNPRPTRDGVRFLNGSMELGLGRGSSGDAPKNSNGFGLGLGFWIPPPPLTWMLMTNSSSFWF